MTQRDPRNLILPLGVVIGLPVIAWLTMGRLPLIVFTFAFGGGFVLYVVTLWRQRIDAAQVIVPYLLTVMLFILHVGEEYLTDFELTVSKINGAPVPENRVYACCGLPGSDHVDRRSNCHPEELAFRRLFPLHVFLRHDSGRAVPFRLSIPD